MFRGFDQIHKFESSCANFVYDMYVCMYEVIQSSVVVVVFFVCGVLLYLVITGVVCVKTRSAVLCVITEETEGSRPPFVSLQCRERDRSCFDV